MTKHKGDSFDALGPAKVLEAISSSVRLLILINLRRHGEMDLTQAIEALSIETREWKKVPTPSNVSEHLQVLRKTGLIQSKKTGRRVIWRVSEAGMAVAQANLTWLIAHFGPDSPWKEGPLE